MNAPWSRGDKIALVGVLVTTLGLIAAVVVVPELRSLLRLDRADGTRSSTSAAAAPESGTSIREPLRSPSDAFPFRNQPVNADTRKNEATLEVPPTSTADSCLVSCRTRLGDLPRRHRNTKHLFEFSSLTTNLHDYTYELPANWPIPAYAHVAIYEEVARERRKLSIRAVTFSDSYVLNSAGERCVSLIGECVAVISTRRGMYKASVIYKPHLDDAEIIVEPQE